MEGFTKIEKIFFEGFLMNLRNPFTVLIGEFQTYNQVILEIKGYGMTGLDRQMDSWAEMSDPKSGPIFILFKDRTLNRISKEHVIFL